MRVGSEASAGGAGNGAMNGDGTRTSSEMNTFGPATLRNVYYHVS
jgi:hypothetical protein